MKKNLHFVDASSKNGNAPSLNHLFL